KFDDVACGRPAHCIAVGEYTATSGQKRPLAEEWDGSRWRVIAARFPPHAVSADLAGISCFRGTCMAVGKYSPTSGPCICQTLSERWSGGQWRIERTPRPFGPGQWSMLAGVSCPRIASCLAVGAALRPGLGVSMLGDVWRAGRWRLVHVPALGVGFSVSL